MTSDPWNYQKSQENIDALALELFKEKGETELTKKDLDRAHRIGKNDINSNLSKPIIAEVIRYKYSHKKWKDSLEIRAEPAVFSL